MTVIAREWLERWKADKAASNYNKVIGRLELDVFPWLGEKPIAKITAPAVLEVLHRIESRGAVDTAHRAKQTISQVMRYAIATGRAERDPCPDLKGALSPKVQSHFASLTNPTEAAALLRAVDQYHGGLSRQAQGRGGGDNAASLTPCCQWRATIQNTTLNANCLQNHERNDKNGRAGEVLAHAVRRPGNVHRHIRRP
ncbi:hypothetical protein AGMMS49960_02740 [Betaproteobacteria bacterium]|nr:hypothetical protein AGMMS49960_02740 [Betaproteobacteria bacterium]GHU21061.1 hypothetical protein AGMMS50243_17790 [Betaproteobacteria bacterium]